MSNSESTQRLAINALFNFAQYKICRPVIISSGVLESIQRF